MILRRWLALTMFGVIGHLPISGNAQVVPGERETRVGVPYSLPVVLPNSRQSPAEDSGAPFTPLVRALLEQLESSPKPTPDEIRRAASLLYTTEGGNGTCHNLANVVAPALTMPRIMPLCFTDGLGINPVSGPNQGRTTGLPSLLMLGSSFDRRLANALGQVEGREGRNLMVTGLLGPQADTDVLINWSRGHQTPGEDPFVNGEISAAEINGIQGQGLMAQVKHFAGYNGTADDHRVDVQDQALHEVLLLPYEIALRDGKAASIMCSYAKIRDASPEVAHTLNALTQIGSEGSASTWPLNEAHFACENPLLLTYVLRQLWHSDAFVGSDYGGLHSASAFLQGAGREDPSANYFGITNPYGMSTGFGPPVDTGLDQSGSTCADVAGRPEACTAVGAIHVAGIPGNGCPAKGCGLAEAVIRGLVPLSLFNQALARVLYQEERFGLLGCDNSSTNCTNPGGIGGDRSGTAALTEGATVGAPELGTKYGDAAIVEAVAEEGAVLLKNNEATLPITPAALTGGIAVSGGGAEYLIGNPNNEGATGFADRNAVSPLEQLQALSKTPSAFHYTPAGSPTGLPVPCQVLRHGDRPVGQQSLSCPPESGLLRTARTAGAQSDQTRTDTAVDFTPASPSGGLPGGTLYRWEGWLYVPKSDTYAFRVQHSPSIPDDKVHFSFDDGEKTLVDATSFYQGQYYGTMSVPVGSTNAGYTEKGLRNRQCAVPPTPPPIGMPGPPAGESGTNAPSAPVLRCDEHPSPGWHKVQLVVDSTDLSVQALISIRFAFSRTHGDIADAAADARDKAMAVVFLNDQGREVAQPFAAARDVQISSLNPDQVELINAVSAANAHTVIVLNTGTPVVVQDWIDRPGVQSLLTMWHAGQEGGTATARLLLGMANPSGHTTITWPLHHSDGLHSFLQQRALYTGDTPGKHSERLNGAGDGTSKETQGIYSGYRYYDQLDVPVQYPFGFGLSYTRFTFSNLEVKQLPDGGATISFDVSNRGTTRGATVAQVYVGSGPELGGVQQAVRSLQGFERAALEPAETRHLSLTLHARAFQYWSEREQAWKTNSGPRSIYVGDADAAASLPLQQVFLVAPESAHRGVH